MEKTTHPDLTAERIAILVEFADNVVVGRKVLHWIAYVGVGAAGIAAFLYYVTSALKNIRVGGAW